MRALNFFILALVILTMGCVKEDHFGPSSEKKILNFTLEGQVGNSQINQELNQITLTIAANADITDLVPSLVTISTFASLSPTIDIARDFSSPLQYIVEAENGSTVAYTIIVTQEGSEPQLENSSFDAWYTTPKGYYEPGADASSIWASGNAGVTTLGTANVNPLLISGIDNAAVLKTQDMGNLAGLLGQRMAAGSMFTGTFKLDLANPLASAKFGSSFSARPSGFSIEYAYSPGSPYLNKNGEELPKSDSCDIYVLLENRNSQESKRIATGWFRSGDMSIDSFTTISINFNYGALGPGIPAYQKPVNNMYATPDDPVTHISVVFSSSHNGALLEGGMNSTLVVNNFRLLY